MKYIFFFISGVMLLVGLNIFFFENAAQPKAAELIVGIENAFPPFELLNAQGNLEGFDCDVIQALAKKLGKSVKFHIMSFDNLILSLQQKKVDLIIAAISITEQRSQEINLIHYHGKPLEALPLIFWKTVPARINTLEDLKDIQPTIGVQSGSIQKEWISSFPFIQVMSLAMCAELILALQTGKITACVLEDGVIDFYKKIYGELQAVSVPLPKAYRTYGHGIGIAQHNPVLTAQVKKAVDDLKQEGIIASLEKKWF